MPNPDDLSTDTDWENFARTDPYWAVLTSDRFRRDKFDAGARTAFFASGEEHIRCVLNTARMFIDPGFTPRRALDFGCGVGRLLLPLAQRCAEVVGVDVSETMLREAGANCRAANNVTLVKGDDDLSGVTGAFDLVHTMMVLQHIPVARGVRIFRRLVELVAPGGCGALHVTYGPAPPTPVRPGGWFRAVARAVVGPFRPRPAEPREMQMNRYPLSDLFQILQEAGANQVHTTFMDQGGVYGAVLVFRKEPRDG
jgi:SAM-dependent methyltransferase